MNNKKYYILVFQYNSIHLFIDNNGHIEKSKFANGKDFLSNCVTFDYDREDLLFLPDGDPFDVNSNSSFSDYLDFAGYHFDFGQAVSEIIVQIEKKKLLPGIKKEDEIIVLPQLTYFESKKDYEEERDIDNSPDSFEHKIYPFPFEMMFRISIDLMMDDFGGNVLFGDQFFAAIASLNDHMVQNVILPTMENSSVTTVETKYQLKTNIPSDLLRNIRNRVVVAKLFNLPIPSNAKYRNQIVDVAHLPLAEMFEEVMDENANIILSKTDETNDDPTFVFDLGMHPKIKEAFIKKTKKIVLMSEEESMDFVCYLIRNMIIEHEIRKDLQFKMRTAKISKGFREGVDIFKFNNGEVHYGTRVIWSYFKAMFGTNPFNNKETKRMLEIINKRVDKQ